MTKERIAEIEQLALNSNNSKLLAGALSYCLDALRDRDATIERLREALEEAGESLPGNTEFQRARLERIHALLKETAK